MPDDLGPKKRCCRCTKEFPTTLEFFHAKSASKDGLRPQCKKCAVTVKKKRHISQEGNRWCTGCEQEFPATLEYFNHSTQVKCGLDSQCKECRRKAQREYKHRDPEKWKQYQKEQRYGNYEHCLEREQAYRDKNREHISEYNNTHRLKFRHLQNAHRREKTEEKRRNDPTLLYKQWGLRWCKKGQHWLPATADYFPRANGKRSGFSAYCKKCTSLYRKGLAYHKKDSYKQRSAQYQREHPEQMRRYHTKWAKKNVERLRVLGHNWRARRKNAEGTHTEKDVRRIYLAQKKRCYYCHRKLVEDITIDHVVPLSRGGSNDPSNLVIACRSCNSRKRHRLPHEWPEGGRLMESKSIYVIAPRLM